MANLVLRSIKGSPITDNEMDSNLQNLNRDSFLSPRNSTPWVAATTYSAGEILNVVDRFYYVSVGGTSGSSAPTHTSGSATNGTLTLQITTPSYYSAKDVIDKVKLFDGVGSGLDADFLRGLVATSVLPTPTDKTSIVSRDSSGNSTFNNLSAASVSVTTLTVNGASVLSNTLSVNGSIGTSGQFLTSRGVGLSPQWTTLNTTPVITSDNTNATRYITFVDSTGTQSLKVDNATTPLTYNPGTNTLTSNIIGDVTGLASGNPTFGANTYTGQQTVPNVDYDATSWNNNFTVPTKHAIRNKIESLDAKFTGIIFDWAGISAPVGSIALPLVPTNVSRTTYANLFSKIGTTWGNGDGVNTFGLPYCPENYTTVQASSNVGTTTVGEVIEHIHTVPVVSSNVRAGGAGATIQSGGTTDTSSTGGAANLAAGVRVLKCIWI